MKKSYPASRESTRQRTGIPTIVRVKYVLLPWKEIAALKTEFMEADAHLRPRVVWKISTEALPRIRPLVQSLIEEIES